MNISADRQRGKVRETKRDTKCEENKKEKER